MSQIPIFYGAGGSDVTTWLAGVERGVKERGSSEELLPVAIRSLGANVMDILRDIEGRLWAHGREYTWTWELLKAALLFIQGERHDRRPRRSYAERVFILVVEIRAIRDNHESAEKEPPSPMQKCQSVSYRTSCNSDRKQFSFSRKRTAHVQRT